MLRFLVVVVFRVWVLFASPVYCQDAVPAEVVHPNQRVEVSNLAPLSTPEGTSTAQVGMQIVLAAQNVHCDKRSEAEAAAQTVTNNSLKDLVRRVSGANCVTERGPLKLAATFVPNSAIQGDDLIAALMHHKPQLIQYRGAVMVLYGVIFDEHLRSDGSRTNIVRTFLMLDPRYQDARRWVVFVRDKDAFSQVDGVGSIEPMQPQKD